MLKSRISALSIAAVLFSSVAHLSESVGSLLWSEAESWSESSVPQLGSCQHKIDTQTTTSTHCVHARKHCTNHTNTKSVHLAVRFHSALLTAAGQEHDKRRNVSGTRRMSKYGTVLSEVMEV